MKNKWALSELCIILIGLTGCASIPKKFIRKKNEPAHIPSVIYFQEGPYQKKYSNAYYYKTHFTLWKSWQDELLLQWNGNSKKVARATQEAYSHLTEMNRYLVLEKQNELKPLLDELSEIVKQMNIDAYAESSQSGVRVELEKIKRIVSNDFYYDKVKDSVLVDDVDLGSGSKSAAPA